MGQQSVSSPTSGNSKGFGSTNPSTSGQAQFGMPNPSVGKGSPTFQGNSQKPTESTGIAGPTQPMGARSNLVAPQSFSGKGGSSPQPAQQPVQPTQPQAPLSKNINDYGPGSQFYNLEPGADPNGIQTYKGIVDEQHPDGIYTDTNDTIARRNAMSTASQQGFSGGAQPAQQPSSGKGGGKYR